MEFDQWYLVVGGLCILLVLINRLLDKLPVTTAMLYVGLGWLLGMLGWLDFDVLSSTETLERLSEIAVIISLFAAGLKLRLPLSSKRWRLPVALALVSMTVCVALVTAVGVFWLGLPLGASIILGAVLAPTDPVLASEVQVDHAQDIDRVRFTLTGEAGLNDGTAFPFVMLGLGVLGLHDLGSGGWRWWAIDVVWAIGGGLLCGALLGISVSRLVIFLRSKHHQAVGLDAFLAIGLIASAYGLAHVVHAYGFLAVFAAGLSMRAVEREVTSPDSPRENSPSKDDPNEEAAEPEGIPQDSAEAVLHFSDDLERVAEFVLLVLVGSILATLPITATAFGVAVVITCLIRPLAVAPVAWAFGLDRAQSALVTWFGIRGVGSLYYLFYAISEGIPDDIAASLILVTISTIVFSVYVHGATVSPFMRLYRRHHEQS